MEKSTISKNLLFSKLHFDLLSKMYGLSFKKNTNLSDILNTITETALLGLNVDRASFWRIVDDKLICINIFDSISGHTILESEILKNSFPIYFDALQKGIAIVADDAKTNFYTRELKDAYLTPKNITDMMDVPVRENGIVTGVLCMERRNNLVDWNETELAFALSTANILSLLLEQNMRRKIENELQISQQKLSLISENSDDGFVIFENQKIVFVSPSYAKLLGFSESECSNFAIDDIFARIHPEDIDLVKDMVFHSLKNKIKTFRTTFRLQSKSGEYFWREDTASIIYNEKGNYSQYIIISRDYSLLKKAELEINSLYHVSKNLNKKLLNFTHIISHNIRSNSSNIAMLIDLIGQTENETEKSEYYKLLKESNEKLDKTIFYLNESINIKSNSEDIKTLINIKTTIQEILKSINYIIKTSNVVFNFQIDDKLEINTVHPYFESIVINLITNAIKYKDNSRVLKIDVIVNKSKNIYNFEVQDNGLGIDLVLYKDKLFGMYKTFHGNEDAVGMGLFMTKNHIEALGGEIFVESQVGVGSNFKFTLNA